MVPSVGWNGEKRFKQTEKQYDAVLMQSYYIIRISLITYQTGKPKKKEQMKKKIKYIFIILICITQFTGCKAKNIKSLSACWKRVESAAVLVAKDMENFSELYEIEEEKMRLISEDWVKNPPTVRKVEKITVPTEEEIKTYLNMTIDEIEKLTGNAIDQSGTLMVFSFNVFFPCLDLDNSPFYFICINYDTSEKPRYLSFLRNYDEEYLSTIGLSENMSFRDIMNLWGETEIEERNRFEEYHYCIRYERNGLTYEFIANNKEGKWFDFFIY